MKEVVALKLNYLRKPSVKRGQQFEIVEILSDERAAGLVDHVPQPEDIVSSCRPGDVIHSGVVHLIGRVTYMCASQSHPLNYSPQYTRNTRARGTPPPHAPAALWPSTRTPWLNGPQAPTCASSCTWVLSTSTPSIARSHCTMRTTESALLCRTGMQSA